MRRHFNVNLRKNRTIPRLSNIRISFILSFLDSCFVQLSFFSVLFSVLLTSSSFLFRCSSSLFVSPRLVCFLLKSLFFSVLLVHSSLENTHGKQYYKISISNIHLKTFYCVRTGMLTIGRRDVTPVDSTRTLSLSFLNGSSLVSSPLSYITRPLVLL